MCVYSSCFSGSEDGVAPWPADQVGMFGVLGQEALVMPEGSYRPDFCAHLVSDSVRVVYVRREHFARACARGENLAMSS